MGMGKFAVLVAGLCAALLVATGPLAASPPGNVSARLLAAHNRERARLGVPRLMWSERLSAEAQAWATYLAQRRAFHHSNRKTRGGSGENLWMGTTGYYSAEDMIGAFLEEGRDFRPGLFPNVSRTGNWDDVSHYTQLIWPTTQTVGCAIARGGGNEVLVCRYWPKGNIDNRRVG